MSVLLSPSFSSSSSSASVKFIIYLLILLTGVQLIDAFCADHQWFNGNECVPCTRCDDSQFFVLRPCQKHTDTVCGTLDDFELELDWLKAAAIAAEHKQVSFLSIGFSLFTSGCEIFDFKYKFFLLILWILIRLINLNSLWESLKNQPLQC